MKKIENANLKSYNTFGIEGYCKNMIIIEQEKDIQLFFDHDYQADERYFVLGGGSNVLFSDFFKGTILHISTDDIQKREETDQYVLLNVAAGTPWEKVTQYALENHLYGIENLAGIPGNTGSCPVQNIGAYGVEVKEVIDKVEGFYLHSGEPFMLTNSECAFGYRNSIFKTKLKNSCLITSVTLRLSKIEKYTLHYADLKKRIDESLQNLSLQSVTDAILMLRNSKLPDVKEVGSAGSFFKNPIIGQEHYHRLLIEFPTLKAFSTNSGEVKLAAGQLIDLCDWKGYREGDAGVWANQALVLVNYGTATGAAILALCKKIQRSVYEKFCVYLEAEVYLL
ncbi:MAG: UDP-N-acetylmuramate dehydrogenase [Bacteroidales bacterium]|jgi:UDP-N-acetylmuramate dehydrogenase|nr:UDP-N-acetylmuramate dehydrogenase [Bacteroidales bacterium]